MRRFDIRDEVVSNRVMFGSEFKRYIWGYRLYLMR